MWSETLLPFSVRSSHLKAHGPALVLLPVVVEDLERGAPLAQLDAPVLHGGGGHDDQVRALVTHLLQVGKEGDGLEINISIMDLITQINFCLISLENVLLHCVSHVSSLVACCLGCWVD